MAQETQVMQICQLASNSTGQSESETGPKCTYLWCITCRFHSFISSFSPSFTSVNSSINCHTDATPNAQQHDQRFHFWIIPTRAWRTK